MILKTWWFELYTLPLLKKTFVLFLFAFAADFFIPTVFEFQYMGLWLFAIPFIPFYMKIFQKSSSFSENIPFHKLHIPLKELQKNFFLNCLTDFISVNVFVLLLFASSSSYGGSIYKDVSWLFSEFSFYQILFYYLCFFAVALHIMTCEKDSLKRNVTYEVFHGGIFKSCVFFIYAGIVSLPFILSYLFLAGFDFVGIMVFSLGICIRSILINVKLTFHKVPSKVSYKVDFKHYIHGNVFAFSLFFICVFGARFDVLDSSLNSKQRAMSFNFSGLLAPEIDIETFRAIEPELESRIYIYSKVDFDPSILGVEYFLDSKNYSRLSTFVGSGKASKEFLISLYDNFETNPVWEDKKTNSFKNDSYGLWPEGEQLPERFQIAKEESSKIQQQYAAEQAQKRRERKMASDEAQN